MAGLAIGFFFLAAALFAALWQRTRSTLRRAAAAREAAEQCGFCLTSVLATAPIAGFRWSRDKTATALGAAEALGHATSYDRWLTELDPPDATRVAGAVEQLRKAGTAFDAAISSHDGSAYAIEGRMTASGEAVLWIADVSAIRRSELARAAAADAAAGLRETTELLPLPVWRRDGRLRLIECNAAYAASLEADRQTVLSESRELAPTRKAATTSVPSRADRAAAGTPQTEMRHVSIGGSRRLLELVEVASRAGGTIGYALDRTEVEFAQNELARHIDAHGQVLESIHAAVAIYGADKRLKFFNSAFARLWPLEEGWLDGEPSLDELLERLRERRRLPEHADARAFKRQQLALFTTLIEPESELLHLPDGRTLSMSVSPHPLGGLIFAYEDVTDRLALERSYNTLIEVQRATLDNLFEAIAVFGGDGRLKLHNPAYRKVWGLAEGDLEGEPHVSDIVDKTRHFYEAADWPSIRERVIARITEEPPWSGSMERSDGSTLRVATMPLPDGNVLLTCLDVSDTARVERALRERNEALETAARLKSEFIANVSYELRTPLNAITGFAEILTNQYFGILSERQLEYSRGILESSQRLSQLINDILDLATIEAGYLALEPGRIEIRELLEAVVSLSRERARMQDVSLVVDCPRGIGAVEADERRLKQSLFNVVSNAIKFTPPGGSVRLEARIDDTSRGDVVLAVVDTGVGIAATDHERVFEKFERGDPHNREAGAGLGLSLVKSLIELHGGSVAIRSGIGEGTTVLCRLPASRRLPAGAPAEPTSPGSAGRVQPDAVE